MNTLISIGYTSHFRCYLNISREEAITRYAISEGLTKKEVEETLTSHLGLYVFEFEDEFMAYDVWAK